MKNKKAVSISASYCYYFYKDYVSIPLIVSSLESSVLARNLSDNNVLNDRVPFMIFSDRVLFRVFFMDLSPLFLFLLIVYLIFFYLLQSNRLSSLLWRVLNLVELGYELREKILVIGSYFIFN